MSNWETDYGICALADCREYLQSMRENSVDMIFTDPAYKGVSGGRTSPASQSYGWNSSVLDKNDGKIFKHNSIKIREYIHLLQRVLKPGGHCYIMINRLNLRDLLNAAHECNFHLTNILAWAKNNKNANRFFMIETEFI